MHGNTLFTILQVFYMPAMVFLIGFGYLGLL
jgi:hypothetical protein